MEKGRRRTGCDLPLLTVSPRPFAGPRRRPSTKQSMKRGYIHRSTLPFWPLWPRLSHAFLLLIGFLLTALLGFRFALIQRRPGLQFGRPRRSGLLRLDLAVLGFHRPELSGQFFLFIFAQFDLVKRGNQVLDQRVKFTFPLDGCSIHSPQAWKRRKSLRPWM